MVDRYTKAILTVIAVCLIVIAFRGIAPVTRLGDPAVNLGLAG